MRAKLRAKYLCAKSVLCVHTAARTKRKWTEAYRNTGNLETSGDTKV